MAAFAKSGFNAATYAAFRPTYPRQLFDFVFQYHARITGARWDTAVDLGCGTGQWPVISPTKFASQLEALGQATVGLTPFKRVVGVDPSSRMLDRARDFTLSLGGDEGMKYEFVQSVAEDLHSFQDGSVDMIVSGMHTMLIDINSLIYALLPAQAGHWYDWHKVWPECARVLRKGGSAAIWASPIVTTLHQSLISISSSF
jgi:trans-aconitate 3-methyltransferase